MSASRNPYKDDIDFTTLALQSPDFAKYLKSNGQLDFTDPGAVRQLTTSLLQRDFDLKVDIPDNRLCPPVPNRLNYILWLQDLLDTTGDDYRDSYDPDQKVVGLDIGTGCCSIYPLLGCSMRPQWNFVATDIDKGNIESSQANISANGLDSRITIYKTDPEDKLIPLGTKLKLDRRLDFTMCNPPFYTSRDEMVASAEAKERPPFSACTGAEVEMVTTGGEVAFISRMIEESLQLRDRVRWYTSMCGKLSSISVLVERLIEHGNNNYAVTEFVQGNKTKRWALAWSWTDRRPTVAVARGIPAIPKHLLPFPSEYTFTTTTESIADVAATINAELEALSVQWVWRKDLAMGVGFAMQNVWSRQARRKMRNPEAMTDQAPIEESKAALGFRVQVKKEAIDEKGLKVIIRWIKGTDTVLFESFCGMLKRKIDSKQRSDTAPTRSDE
ncbi:DUF890 domain protein [Aspergillus homomorphus CBS 101889]|uniref:U6 small nuclear RNA (adenine-(43)-N(6))-methyltransferase n=1 Tax=Aspergillus homomorphus (strain CBS 101889) TaxID=1450537 RepID=A0A395HMS6_ASPHC|nr:hypothetical protein BO97DRAFT_353827 [Aspergillus homomorphus CBS 101889]RAL08555.1 hypothetical protein BO97DRAFT_353827 [Aspergillus homomorphus CBS 101889]